MTLLIELKSIYSEIKNTTPSIDNSISHVVYK